LPFGSGANLCLGRQFTKIHYIVTLAIITNSFNYDILARPKVLMPNLRKFGIGVVS
jgi:cytochrome P450